MERIPKRIALVYDRVNKWGGAERVLLALHQLFPQAPLFTGVYDASNAAWAKVFPEVIPSFLQKIPFAGNHHEFFPFLTPMAFESFSFTGFDAVISVTSADAKGILTPPDIFHMCYCLTPTRYLWSHHEQYKNELGKILEILSRPSFKYLKYWDLIASRRPDAYVSISQTVRSRVLKYYGQDSPVVYPPVDVDRFSVPAPPPDLVSPNGYFLYVGRLVPYKRADVVIRAFNRTKLPLVITGSGNVSWGVGSFESRLRQIAGPNVVFTGQVSETELVSLYKHCRAVVFFNEEDFGIVPVEAQAAGVPVIGLNRGGTTETVISGRTGILLDDDSDQGLAEVILKFNQLKFSPRILSRNAAKFSLERFNREFVKVFTTEWQKFNHTYIS